MTTQTRRTNTEGPKEKSHVPNYLKSVPINFHLFVPTTSISLAWYNLRHGHIANPYHALPPLCPHLPRHCAPHAPHALARSHYCDRAFVTCLAMRPLWHALVWTLLLVGWTITIILLDWGLHWYFIMSVLSCI